MVGLNLEIPNDFFNEEVRCGYTISNEMKQVWAIELDLLKELDRVCQKYKIRYCADGGTLLGAIRHKGFVPWDDDIDIAMTRNEYNRLCEVASKEFKNPYFFQTFYTDNEYTHAHAQLRNADTTAILNEEKGQNRKFNQGIFLDIFPFDNIPDSENDRESLYKVVCKKAATLQKITELTIYYDKKRHYSSNKWKNFVKKLLFRPFLLVFKPLINYKKAFSDLETACQDCKNDKTLMVADLCVPFVGLNRIQRYAEDFLELEYCDFEFTQIPVFKNYDRNLQLLYGNNYMKPSQAPSEHSGVFFDVSNSYRTYIGG